MGHNPNDEEKEKINTEDYTSDEVSSSNNNGSDDNGSIEVKSEEIFKTDEISGESGDYNELYDKYVRLTADFENYKKRLAREKADIISYGNEELIKALLNVLDNFERALEHADEQDDSMGLIEGVKLVHKHFVSCLEKFGVTQIDSSKGTEFDPRYHQAIERIETNELTPGLIISVMVKGYLLKERLLRPALVVVSKGSINEEAIDNNNSSDTISDSIE